MKYLKPVILTLFIVILSSFPTLQTKICHCDNLSSTIVDNLYSSVVLITNKKLKTSAWEALRFAAFVAGELAGTGSFGVGSYIPAHTEKSIGTGFQTKWGVVTNFHVIDAMPKAVLTTFYRSSYRIKKINRVLYRDHHTFINIPKTIQLTSKEATIYDRGSMDIDLALIHVKIPGAFPLPLAKEVNIGEKVFTLGHPSGIQFTPSPIGTIKRIYRRKGAKHIQLSIQSIGGMSGSPVLNMKGEVVGIIRGHLEGSGTGEAVHVEELRKTLGLPIYNVPEKKYLPAIELWSGAVYSTEYSRLFHQPDCNELISNDGDLITFLSREAAMKNGGKPCPECNP
ncbi:MAG: trypsin-like peptidase domain-containing protein [Candidatus Brocadiales bacterium]|nr:trypsin-like peptidase domain-containing protein [Candidatus Brocadiales bacterium]